MTAQPSGPISADVRAHRTRRALMLTACLLVLGAADPAALRADELDDELATKLSAASSDQMLVEAERLVYDYDRERISAVGRVEIYYEDYYITAERVEYDQRSGRLTASGGVRIIEPGRNVIEAEEIDLTDDFREGFLRSLRVRTPYRARFAAHSAERRDGNLTIFRQGVYTACEPCKDHPERPPFWQIKASTIIVNRREQTIEYENARLEIMGVPVAYWPYFFHPDPQVKRKSGFIMPTFSNSQALGVGLQAPYFVNLAPNYDLTISPTIYSHQGLLGQAEWRHRLANGAYSVRATGIFQLDKDRFVDETGSHLSGFRDWRGSIQTQGTFAINSRWLWGWDITATSDRTYGRDYAIEGATDLDVPSTVFLTGMSEQNYFDVRGYAFRVQRENTVETDATLMAPPPFPKYTHDDQIEQAIVHPVADHNYVVDHAVFGGELRIDSNVTSLSRIESDIRKTPVVDYYAGIAGTFARASTDASWQRRMIGPGGQVFTPFAYIKGELNFSAFNDSSARVSESTLLGRAMPAVGIEYEWPFVAHADMVTQTFGPIAQIIARPNETNVGRIPNEDSQSLVFDDTTLFERDKFSGYDRMEGGTRANLGVSYQARFRNGASIDALVGQSFHLAGQNSFELADPALAGADSGLDKDSSDIVGRVTLDTGRGIAVTARGRLDSDDFSVERAEISAGAVRGRSGANISYAFISRQPIVGINEDRSEILTSGRLALGDSWTASGSLIYDLQNGARVGHSFGLAFDSNGCFNLEASYSQTRDRYTDAVTDRKVYVRLNFRTISDGDFTSSLGPPER